MPVRVTYVLVRACRLHQRTRTSVYAALEIAEVYYQTSAGRGNSERSLGPCTGKRPFVYQLD